MRTSTVSCLAIIAAFAATATESAAVEVIDKYLVDLNAANSLYLSEVLIRPDGAIASTIAFGEAGGAMDPSRREIHGVDLSGSQVTVPLEDVVWIRVRRQLEGQISFESLRLDAVLGRPTWPPRGPVLRVVLLGGTVIEFDDMAPEVLTDTRELRWFGEDQSEVLLSPSRVIWIEHERHDGNTPRVVPNLTGVPASATMRSGETAELLGRHGRLDPEWDRVSCEDPDWDVPLDSVSILRIAPPPPVVAPPPPVAYERFETLNELSPDQRVRIKVGSHDPDWGSHDSDWMTGTFMGVQDGEISLRSEDDSIVTVSKDEVEEFQVSEGTRNNSGTGAVIGACVGGGIGVVVGVGLANMTIMGDSNNTSEGGAAALGFMVGALIGGAFGALTGSLSSTEQFEYLDEFGKPLPTDPPDGEMQLGFAVAF